MIIYDYDYSMLSTTMNINYIFKIQVTIIDNKLKLRNCDAVLQVIIHIQETSIMYRLVTA